MFTPDFTPGRIYRSLAIIGMLAAMATSGNAAAQTHYGFGKPATPEEIAGWDIDARPDGSGLPQGSGSVEQGKALYAQLCLACHGEADKGGTAPALAGGEGTLATPKPKRTIGSFWPYATTLFDYINRAMPWDKPQSLKPGEVYALTAMLLNANKIVPDDAVMSADTLPKVQMPNQGGFKGVGKSENLVQGVRCMKDCR